MGALATALAAFFSILVVRKLPGIKTLVQRGVKPFACSVCMAAWASLFWVLFDALVVETRPSVTAHVLCELFQLSAYVAAVTFLILTTYEWLKSRLDWIDPDEAKPSDYKPPGDA